LKTDKEWQEKLLENNHIKFKDELFFHRRHGRVEIPLVFPHPFKADEANIEQGCTGFA